jgi:signal transduction histidine kinase
MKTIDWRLVLMGLPKRRFTAAELQRAIPDPPDRSLRAAVIINVLLTLAVFVGAFGNSNRLTLALMLLPFAVFVPVAFWAAWRDPGHRGARWAYYLLPAAMGLGLALVARHVTQLEKQEAFAIASVALAASLCLWFAIVYRHKFVEMRLRELDERDRAVAMARQLAAAQIQPHFLFNSLASLQHWVQAKDDRAAPMLDALTGFLRETLPLFERERLSLGDEAQAVQRYLEVMQLRLGDRLAFTLDIEPRAAAAPVPPGLLLTLVENAIEHGVQPTLRGATVAVSARIDGGRVVVEVRDDGAGLDPAATDGVGLANSRQRLAQAWGSAATLALQGAPGDGCTARIEFPFTDPPAPPT